MKKYISLLIFLFPILLFSQENRIENDSISTSSKSEYIENRDEQLNIKFDIVNDQVSYFMPFEGEKATVKTNLKPSLGFVFSYKFLSIRLGIRPAISKTEEENKGETDYFKLRVKFLFDKWTHNLEYRYTRGFYVENTEDFDINQSNSDYHIQLPSLTTNILSGSSQYKFNNKFSIKAIESNTEIQLKSAGTFMTGINYSYYDIKDAYKIIDENGDIILRNEYNDFSGFNFILNGGYHYTYIIHSYWFLYGQITPGIGFDFYKTSYYYEDTIEETNNNDLFFFVSSAISAGYNGKKYYFGAEFNYSLNSDKFSSEKYSLQPIKNNFTIFIGYRFKAPKQVSKPVDYIENKVPILKDDEN